MSGEECIHGLGPVEACVICNGRAAKEQSSELWWEFAAKYPGQCRACNLPITPGQWIAWRPDDPPVHLACRP